MSVGREFGHTIAECRALDGRLAQSGLPIPMKMMVDIDHGDVTSSNPDDIDPYAWAQAFPKESPIIHIKQSSMNKGGHWPFIAAHNKDGRIMPEKLLDTVRRGGGTDNEICLELSFREREAGRPPRRRYDPRDPWNSGSRISIRASIPGAVDLPDASRPGARQQCRAFWCGIQR